MKKQKKNRKVDETFVECELLETRNVPLRRGSVGLVITRRFNLSIGVDDQVVILVDRSMESVE